MHTSINRFKITARFACLDEGWDLFGETDMNLALNEGHEGVLEGGQDQGEGQG